MELNIIASQVEANTTASFPILLEDETFKNMFEKEIKTSKNLFDIAQALSKFANEELIQKGYMKMKMNYKVISKKMEQNKLPTNKNFIKEFENLISNSH